jgi:MarR family transcriptional regulator, lower aerobic nicotinate degradation pathway regulator
MPSDVTPTQWAALTKLAEVGPTSQNHLGRMTAMDVATIKGVVDRLTKRGFVRTRADVHDARRRLVVLTSEGTEFVTTHVAAALTVTEQTLAPLDERERTLLLWLLTKMM